MALTAQNISKVYPTRNGITLALDRLSFDVNDREFVCIIGPSGCGKTTLLKLIAGLLQPTSGQIIYTPTGTNAKRRTALVFQEHGLFPWMTVADNIAFGLETRGIPRAARLARADRFIETVGLSAFARHYPHELSVGMQQRVGIARAFVADAEILLMDEPFGALDAQTKQVLREELLRVWNEHQKTILFVTHDIEEAILLGDRILVMTGRPGRIQVEIPIQLKRPRQAESADGVFMVETKWRIWKMLEKQVKQNLSIPN